MFFSRAETREQCCHSEEPKATKNLTLLVGSEVETLREFVLSVVEGLAVTDRDQSAKSVNSSSEGES
jgi:hypothetical protein